MNTKYSYYKQEKDLSLFPIIEGKALEVDWELYFELLNFRSHSRSKTMRRYSYWLESWVTKNVPTAKVRRDKFNNLYITKGEADLYPCVVSHIDINQDDEVWNFSIIKTTDWILGVDNVTGKQCGLGADDKNGNLICLEMLRQLDVVKVFFSTDEEVGCVGSHGGRADFFHNCTMLLQADRNSYAGPEFISYTNGWRVCSEDFITAVSPIFEKYNYIESVGNYTDKIN